MLRAVARVAGSQLRPCNVRTLATSREKKVTPKDVSKALSRNTELYKTYKPVTPGIRHLRRPVADHLYEGRPLRALTIARRKKGGRNNHGHITVRHRGGGHKQRLRIIDFMRIDPGPQDVIRIEYDPGRSAHIALIRSRDPNANGGTRFSYILAPDDLRAGDVVESFRSGIPDDYVPGFKNADLVAKSPEATANDDDSGFYASTSAQSLAIGLLRQATVKPGNVLPLSLVPIATPIHAIGLRPSSKALLCRSAGTYGEVTAHDELGKYAQVRLQSGEIRKVLKNSFATVGKVSNPLWKNRILGKAGRSRWLGRRPSVRGMAMNAVDHPHGGGRGKSKGNKHPRSIWGWLTKGKRTRRPGEKGPKNSNKLVVVERPRGKERRKT